MVLVELGRGEQLFLEAARISQSPGDGQRTVCKVVTSFISFAV